MFKKISRPPAEKLAAYSLLFLMAAGLLPVMYLGRYNHPTGDDYYYGAETRIVWEETGSIRRLLEEAVRGVALQYERWQGSYSAMLLMYLPPNLFDYRAYRCVTSVILLLLTGSVFYLLKPVVCSLWKGTRSLWLILSALMVLLWVQTVPFQGESFFWYNGSMYYTGYYSLTLIFLGMALRYSLQPKRHHIPVMLVLAVFLAGGNYVSMLPALLLIAGLALLLLLRKKKTQALGITAIWLTALLCFLINVLAPGNQARKEGMWSIPAWKAIVKSLLQGFYYIRAWSSGWLFLSLLLLTPFLWKTFSRTSFRFRWPAAVLGLGYGVFCSMSCPTFYTMNSTGPARVAAIVYYSCVLFVVGAYTYILGYVCQLLSHRCTAAFSAEKKKLLTGAAFLIFFLFTGIQTVKNLAETTAGKAVALLTGGEAAAYELEYQERLRILEDDRIRDVVFLPYEHQPEMLYVGDFGGSPEDETNRKVAQYYHKNSVCVDYQGD